MIKLTKNQLPGIAPLFADSQETLVWSCLQGCMGDAWADDAAHPAAAMLMVCDFGFPAGDSGASGARALLEKIPSLRSKDYLIMVPQQEGWTVLAEDVFGKDCERVTRYAIKKEGDVFDRERLQGFVDGLHPDYQLRAIDEALYHSSQRERWSEDFCQNFLSYADYAAHGLGYMILHNGAAAAGVSSYSYYDKGIEIEIATKKEYRRQGLAAVCASALILDCLERGLYPSWDAQNLWSVALAEKLGYHLDREYPACLINL